MSKNKTLLNIVRVAVTVVFFVVLFWKMRGDLPAFIDSVKNAKLIWFIPSLLAFALIPLMNIVRWRYLLNVQGVYPSVKNLTKYFFIGLFFNNFMLGLTGGDLIKAYYISKETKDKKAEAVITVFIDRIIGMFALITIAVIALLFHMGDPRFKHAANVIFLVFAAFSMFGLLFINKNLLRKIPLVERIYSVLPFKHMISKVYHAFYIYRDYKLVLLITYLISLCLQVVMVFIIFGIGKSFGVDNVSIANFFLFIPVIAVISALPISVGGLGVGESAFVYFFNLVHVQSARYLAMALGIRLVMVLWSLVGGIFMVLPQYKVTEEELEKIEKLEDEGLEEEK